MNWIAEKAVEDFRVVASLAGHVLSAESILIEHMGMPHDPPTSLPSGKMAVYVFFAGSNVLKVGKVGVKSGARYTSQPYNPGSAPSTLATKILEDRIRMKLPDGIDRSSVGRWIGENVGRINFLLEEEHGIFVLTLLEAYLQCLLKPRYEGFKSQNVE